MKEQIKKKAKEVILLFYIVSILTYCTEAISRNSFYTSRDWVCNHVLAYFFTILLNLLIVLIIHIIVKKVGSVLYIVFVPSFIFSFVEYQLNLIRGDHFIPSFLKLTKEAIEISDNFDISITFTFVIALIVLFIASLAFKNVNFFELNWKPKGVFVVFFIIILAIYSNNLIRVTNNFVTINKMSVDEKFEKYGFINSFISEIKFQVKKPDNYSKKEIIKVLNENNNIEEKNEEMYPNIIYILCESFSDITQFSDYDFSEELTPNINRLIDEYTSTKMLSPTYGGMTCNVEFEVLTAIPAYNIYLTSGISYSDYVNDNSFKSIISILKEKNYKATAIHPFTKNFYERDTVYDYLGFDKKIFIEDMEEPIFEGKYVSDKYVYDLLIEEFEEHQRNSEELPFFSHIITMQNHADYAYEYNKHKIEVVSNNHTAEERKALTTYANLLKESDEALQRVIDYFTDIDEPTIILFYGDHSSVVFPEQNVKEVENYARGLQTPLLIWNNYGLEKEELPMPLSAYKISPIILNMANLNQDEYFNYILDSNVLNAVNKYKALQIFYEDNTLKKWEELTDQAKEKMNELEHVIYYRLFEEN